MDDEQRRNLVTSTAVFRQVFHRSHDAIMLVDPDADRIVEANESACSLLGYDYDELLDRSPEEIHPDEVDRFRSFVSDVHADGDGYTEELGCVRSDGQRIPTEISASVVEYDGRECLLAIVRDVSDRIQYRRRLEALNGVSRDLMTADSRESVAETVVTAVEERLEQPLAAVWWLDRGANTLRPVTATTDAEAVIDGSLPELGSESVEMEVVKRGEPRAVDYPTLDSPGHPELPLQRVLLVPLGAYGLLSVGSRSDRGFDESTRQLLEILGRNAEAALEHVEREAELREREAELTRQNERLQEFASVVSHDLRNPLNVAQGYLTLLDSEGGGDSTTTGASGDSRGERDEPTAIERIESALDRMETLVDDLLTLARQGESVSDPERVELDDLVWSCWQTITHDGMELRVDVPDDYLLQADEERLQEVFENLFRNAEEHGDAETIWVETTDTGFAVEDDGTGVPDSVTGELFEAGVSTADEGTGFGLRIVQQVVEAHGWAVELVPAERDDGARFEVTGVETVSGSDDGR